MSSDPLLKYKVAFSVKPESIIKTAREIAQWDVARSRTHNTKKKKIAFAMLKSLGVSVFYFNDIIAGHVDIVEDEEGWLCLIDHRVTKSILERLIE